MIEIFTVGVCSDHSGSGGWGAVLLHPTGHEEHLSGALPKTTKNRMELWAAIQALTRVPAGQDIRITTDSEYVMRGMTEWIEGWIRNDWKNRKGKPVKNREQWQALRDAARRHRTVSWAWVKGYRGHPQNELADQLAVSAIHRLTEDATGETSIEHVTCEPGESHATGAHAGVPLRQVPPEHDVRVIRTDNYNAHDPVEYFVAQRLTLHQAQQVARALNEAQDADAPDYFRVVDCDYQLAGPHSPR